MEDEESEFIQMQRRGERGVIFKDTAIMKLLPFGEKNNYPNLTGLTDRKLEDSHRLGYKAKEF